MRQLSSSSAAAAGRVRSTSISKLRSGPSARLRHTACTRRRIGAWFQLFTQATTTRWRAASSARRSASASVVASGFSTRAWTLARAASSAAATCRCGGVHTSMKSSRSLASIASTLAWIATPGSIRAATSRRAGTTSTTDETSTPSARKAPTCARSAMIPNPTMPQRRLMRPSRSRPRPAEARP